MIFLVSLACVKPRVKLGTVAPQPGTGYGPGGRTRKGHVKRRRRKCKHGRWRNILKAPTRIDPDPYPDKLLRLLNRFPRFGSALKHRHLHFVWHLGCFGDTLWNIVCHLGCFGDILWNYTTQVVHGSPFCLVCRCDSLLLPTGCLQTHIDLIQHPASAPTHHFQHSTEDAYPKPAAASPAAVRWRRRRPPSL
jgi:hypothetical protein